VTVKFELKAISADGIPHALEKADRYRVLNDPEQAESICRDILAVDADNQEALRVMVLALTDQFQTSHRNVREAREYIVSLADEYDRAYFTGIVFEREARAYLERSAVRSAAYDGFRQAMDWYEKAEAHRPPGNVDAMLRWNSCVRTIERERLEPAPDERELPLE
jgi:hypothetical protein